MRYEPSDVDGERTPPAGIPMGAAAPAGYASRDDTTRYLCAAAHLDPEYANEAIKEFLVEPTRAVPPSPGLNTAAVLSEAVAARTRRKLVDSTLILLLAGVVVATPLLVVGWLVVAMIMALVLAGRIGAVRVGKGALPTMIVVGGILVLFLALTPVLDELTDSSSSARRRRAAELAADQGADVGTIIAILLIGLIITVLLVDRFTVWRLVTQRFSRLHASQVSAPAVRERPILQYSPPRFVGQLNRFLNPMWTLAGQGNVPAPQGRPGDPVPVIVHRGYDPFVGAGKRYRPWSIAVPLQHVDESKPATPLSTSMLYLGIAKELDKMRSATGLTPGMRLRELTIDEQIIVPAGELIDHLAEPAAADFLQDIVHPPYNLLSDRRTRQIRDNPIEWARYYLRFQVETWDRDLTMSVYLHVAMDDTMLYVEWTPCLLYPIKQRYQHIDNMTRSPILPLGQTLADLLTLPASVIRRLVHTVKLIRPIRRDHGVINPDMFGSLRSLREMAADSEVHNYFQLADQDRYLKILESRFVRTVAAMMHEAGYATASFEQQAATVFNTSVHIGGSVTGNVVAGQGNTVTPAAAPTPTSNPPTGGAPQ
jgi:hypothetical protein